MTYPELDRPILTNKKVIVLGTLSIIAIAVIFLLIADILIGERFMATLPNGITVELLGICEHPSVKKQWWRPDGSKINGAGFEDFHFKNSDYAPEFYEQNRVFAIRIGGKILKEMKLTCKLSNSINSSFNIAYNEKDEGLLKSKQTLVAKFTREVKNTDLVIEIASGKWKVAAFGNNGRTEAETNDSITNRSVIFHKAIQQNDAIELSATHSLGFDYDCRIIVVGLENEVHEPTKRSTSADDIHFCCKGTFDISPDQIKNIQLEARPYEWIVFKNVSLQQGLKTDCEIDIVAETHLQQVLLDEY
jgi:hypothetical protein